MATPTLSLPGYKALGGTARNFLEEATGKIISRRQFQKLAAGISFEQKAAANKAANELEQLARPAKGRKSVVKAAPEFKKSVITARAEKKTEKELQEKANKEMAAKVRMVQRKAARKVYVKKIRDQLLEAGKVGARIPFNTYEEYVDLWKQIQKMGAKIFAYGLGIMYIVSEERKEAGEEYPVTVFRMMAAGDFVSREDFFDAMDADREQRSYMRFAHYWMHLKFSNKFAQEKATRAGIKRNFNLK